MILEALKNLFEDKSTLKETAEDEGLGIAAGVLMLEIARADDEIDDLEKEVVIEGVKNILHKTNHEINEIFKKVIAVVEESVSFFEFTSLINDSCSRKEKYDLLVILWKVAYADGQLDKYEEYYIRKIKDLLYLSQSDFIKAKLEAKP
jgi:uncharacterized tellurite resistance protein B-like protein|tara:strand:+ start:973 stop:1416 length:444 start_codon:yes stop_codon:yes gene_type:complete